MDKIDFILPWVDGDDKKWKDSKNKYSKNSNESNYDFRYRDMNTLKYVLRSIEQNCPWYNKIYLITTGHYPKWLNINHPKIVLITHDELYFNNNHLPVFNSSSIEMNLANLKNISEKIVYLNDDMIILKKLSKDRFFKNNLPVDFFSHAWLPRNNLFKLIRGMDTWVYSIKNNIDLINKKFFPYNLHNRYLYNSSYSHKMKLSNFLLKHFYKKAFWIQHWHFPQAYLKSTFLNTREYFKKDMEICSSNKFRQNNDLTQYLYRYYQLINENFYPHFHNDGYILSPKNNNDLKKKLFSLEKKDISFLCVNDSKNLENNEFYKIKETLNKYLENNLSQKASFEL